MLQLILNIFTQLEQFAIANCSRITRYSQFLFTLHSRNTVNSCTRTILKFSNKFICTVLSILYYTQLTIHEARTITLTPQTPNQERENKQRNHGSEYDPW